MTANLSTDFRIFIRMAAFVSRIAPVLSFGVIVIKLFQGILPVATAWIWKTLFDVLVEFLQTNTNREDALRSFLPLLIGYVIISLVIVALGIISNYFQMELARQVSTKSQVIILTKLTEFDSLAHFENPSLYNNITMATRGAQNVSNQLLIGLFGLLEATVTIVSFFWLLFLFNTVLLLGVVLSVLPSIFLYARFSSRKHEIFRSNIFKQRRAAYLMSLLSDNTYIKEVLFYGLGQYFLSKFISLNSEFQNQLSKLDRIEAVTHLVLEIVSSIVMLLVTGFVVIQALARAITVGDIGFYLNAFNGVRKSLENIMVSFVTLRETGLYFREFEDLLSRPSAKLVLLPPKKSIRRLQVGIEFKNVSFRYSEDQPWILRDLNLSIPQGKSVALVGENGAGKSTIVKLLARLYEPTEGVICWDGIDIRHFDPVDIRTRMAAIFQDYVRFDLSLKENIAVGNIKEVEDFKLVTQVATKVGLEKLLTTLPNGYNTILSRWLNEDGLSTDLSGGQWQKVALARMMMRESDVIVLDEPTSALDIESEKELYELMRLYSNGKSSLYISHRMSTIRFADIIAVIENGRIAEYGSHQELVAQGGIYSKLQEISEEIFKI
ncbi:MAG: ABC transporter ATP-binding protein [Chloroflexi bacterium]|uniref:ABC transporter ATP-binding protein n=1 Tax=Candidatus Flexifilum breve TaxID=3140694 RepID=UPI00313688F2|nr:ABC transporter ATP-binding protein [Chloroflexota bacterium]